MIEDFLSIVLILGFSMSEAETLWVVNNRLLEEIL